MNLKGSYVSSSNTSLPVHYLSINLLHSLAYLFVTLSLFLSCFPYYLHHSQFKSFPSSLLFFSLSLSLSLSSSLLLSLSLSHPSSISHSLFLRIPFCFSNSHSLSHSLILSHSLSFFLFSFFLLGSNSFNESTK